jgi:putative NADH-flavin reductase
MKRICVFGASRGTGKEIVTIARQRNFAVTAAVRSPRSQMEQDVRVVASDVCNSSTIAPALEETLAVISTVGPVRRAPSTTIYSEGVMNIARQMEKSGPRRLIIVDSIGVDPKFDLPWIYQLAMKFIATPLYGFAFRDAAEMERRLPSANLDWTVVRVPWLVNAPPRGFRSSIGKRLHHGPKLGRQDLAEYLLSILFDPKTFNTWTEVAW